VSPAGRVIFVVCESSYISHESRRYLIRSYIDSLMAVPIVASFAVQTVTKIVTIFPLVYIRTLLFITQTTRNVSRTTPHQTKGSPHWPYIRRYMVESNMSTQNCASEACYVDERPRRSNHDHDPSLNPAYRFTAKCTADYIDGEKIPNVQLSPGFTYIIRGWSKPDGRIIVDAIGATRKRS